MKRCFAFVMIVLLLWLPGCRSSSPEAPQTEIPTATTATTEPVMSYVEVYREGERSQIPVQIIRGTVGNYTIAMDPEYFRFSGQETMDLFSYEGWEGDIAVSYSISNYRADADAQQFIDDSISQFGHMYEACTTEQTTIAGFDATAVYFSSYKDAPSYETHLFLLDCSGAFYLIEATFDFEMYEGLYAIMRACFDTFTPIG